MIENSCSISHSNIKVFVTDFINEDKIVYYQIVIICLNSSKTWQIKARYSVISELNNQIEKYLKKNKNIHVKLPEFPAKKWWVVQDEQFLDQRNYCNNQILCKQNHFNSFYVQHKVMKNAKKISQSIILDYKEMNKCIRKYQ